MLDLDSASSCLLLDSRDTSNQQLNSTFVPLSLAEIPGFELGTAAEDSTMPDDFALNSPSSPSSHHSNGSLSATNSRRGSEASEKMVKVDPSAVSGDEDDDDDEMQDEESEFRPESVVRV